MVEKEREREKKYSDEPFLNIRENGGVFPLYLSDVLQRVIQEEEERRKRLEEKIKEIGNFSHGKTHPPSKREQRDQREALRREIEKQPAASSCPLVRLVLASSPASPIEISSELLKNSPFSGRLPQPEIYPDSFYAFICEGPAKEALAILEDPPSLYLIREIFNQRLSLYREFQAGTLSSSVALTQFIEWVKPRTIPPSLEPWVKKIANKFPLTPSQNHRRF